MWPRARPWSGLRPARSPPDRPFGPSTERPGLAYPARISLGLASAGAGYGARGMMRKRHEWRAARRCIVAILIALAVAAARAGCAGRSSTSTDGAARSTMTTAQKQKVKQYINAHPEVADQAQEAADDEERQDRQAQGEAPRSRARPAPGTESARPRSAKRSARPRRESGRESARRGAVHARRSSAGPGTRRRRKRKKAATSATDRS